MGDATQGVLDERAPLAHRHFIDALQTVRPADWFASSGAQQTGGGNSGGAAHGNTGGATGGPDFGGRLPRTPPRGGYGSSGGLPAGRDAEKSNGSGSIAAHSNSYVGSGDAVRNSVSVPINGSAPVGGGGTAKSPGNGSRDQKIGIGSNPAVGDSPAKQPSTGGQERKADAQKPAPGDGHEQHAYGVANASQAFSGPGPVAPSPARDRPPPRRAPGPPAVHSST